jgi:hypothetical protein
MDSLRRRRRRHQQPKAFPEFHAWQKTPAIFTQPRNKPVDLLVFMEYRSTNF